MPITFTPEQLDRAVRLLAHLPGKAQQAMARAMNRALEGARAAAAKAIRGEYRVSAADVKKTMTLRWATPARLDAEVKSVAPRVALFAFGPKPNEPGTGGPGRPTLRVGVKRAGGRKPLKGAFVVRLGRKLHVASRKGAKRSPLEVHFGPAVPQMLHAESVTRQVEAVAQQRLDARLEHELGRALEQADR